LADFLRGFEHAVCNDGRDEAEKFLPGFRDWIYRRLQVTDNATWDAVILRQSKDETEAVERFWGLLDEYLQKTLNGKAAPKNGVSVVSDPTGNSPVTEKMLRNENGAPSV
jgi:hypothetical protein